MSRSRARRGDGLIGRVDEFQLLVAFILPLVALVGRTTGAVAPEAQAEAERSIAAAALAESRGDISRATALLEGAIRCAPDKQLAHWLLGEIKVDNKWKDV